MKEERIHQIHDLLKEKSRISFNVSKNTIELEEMSIIRKVYGGITPLEPFSAREIRNINEKQIVAATAANFVNDGEIIYIDSGITTMHMIPYLADKQFLTIVTASVYVLDVAARYSNFNIIATGGTLQASLKDFIGSSVLNCI